MAEIQNTTRFLQEHINSNFTKFQQYVSSIWRLVQIYQEYPLFVNFTI